MRIGSPGPWRIFASSTSDCIPWPILKRQSQTRHVPVLFLTGRTDVRDRITAMQVGGSDFISKPFHARDLRAKVRTPDGKLRWKVKLGDAKIKIADNEENKNPFEVKTKEAVLALNAIPPIERYVIVAELLARGR